MAQIKIVTRVPKQKTKKTIDLLYFIYQTEPNLSYRSRKELEKAYKNKNIYFAMKGNCVMGWIMRVAYTQNCQELAGIYVLNSYRRKGIFKFLLTTIVKLSKYSILVTFQKKIADQLIQTHNFEHTSLSKVIVLSKFKFILTRLHLQRFLAIHRHYTETKAFFLLYHLP